MSAAWPVVRSGSPRSPARRRSPGGASARANAAAPIVPLPIVSCRSRVEPHGVLGVVGVDQPQPVRRRPSATSASSVAVMPPGRGQVVPGRPGVAGVEADAQPRVARRPRPGTAPGARTRDARSARRPRSARPAACGPPAAAARSSSGSSASRTWCSASSACPSSTELPAWKTTAGRADRRAPAQRVRQRRRPTARPSPRWASRGSPAATRGCTRAARAPRSRPGTASSCAGSPGGSAQPRELET